MTEADVNRFAGAGVRMCYSDYGALEQAAYRKMSESRRRSDWRDHSPQLRVAYGNYHKP